MRPMDRRTFLQTSIATTIASSFSLRAFAAERKIDRIGLQLYTVRDAMKTDFEGTILARNSRRRENCRPQLRYLPVD